MGRAGLEKEPHQVAAMFDEVADGYDRANTFISLFQDRRWRRHMVRTLQLLPGHRVLDVAAGTAVLRAGHRFHLRKVLPMMARRFSSNPAAYSYLAESTEAWMDPTDLGKTIAGAGWTSVAWRSMTFGVVALHHAIRDEH